MNEGEDTQFPEPAAPAASLRGLLTYFLYLGTFGFGGPIALAGAMHRDLVENRRWFTPQEYKEGLALAQLAPGPLAAQLAIYLGWVKAGVLGATAVAASFILPSFLMVLGLADLYVRFGGLSWMQSAFYGVGAAVIALIAGSAIKMVKMTVGKDRLLWVLFAASAITTGWTESEVAWLFIASGVVAVGVRWRGSGAPPLGALFPTGFFIAGGLAQTSAAAVSWPLLVQVAITFAEAGAFVFGSGLAIVPFLHAEVVNQLHWLNERQFLDAVAVAMITPGPVVITVAFIGYLVAGTGGAVSASLGVFLPCYLFVIIPAPYFRRFAGNPRVKAFVDGVTAAATGAIAGAVFVLGRRALVDIPAVAIAAFTWLAATRGKRIPEPLLILAAALAGLLLRRA